MTRQRRSGTAMLALLFLATFSVSSVEAAHARAIALPGGALDITATARGQRLVRETADRYAAKGLEARPLRAIKDAAGYLVTPADTTFSTVQVDVGQGRKGIALAPLTPKATVQGPAPAVATISPSWTFQGNGCFTRFGNDDYSWMDHCYTMYRLSSDGNGTFDWFALDHYATVGANSPWVVYWAKIRAYRSGSSPQTWADWSPKSDWTGGSCGTISVSVTVLGAGASASVERCPSQWNFTKSANGTSPDYTLEWDSSGTRSKRELEFIMAVRVAQGGWAQWALPSEVHGFPY